MRVVPILLYRIFDIEFREIVDLNGNTCDEQEVYADIDSVTEAINSMNAEAGYVKYILEHVLAMSEKIKSPLEARNLTDLHEILINYDNYGFLHRVDFENLPVFSADTPLMNGEPFAWSYDDYEVLVGVTRCPEEWVIVSRSEFAELEDAVSTPTSN